MKWATLGLASIAALLLLGPAEAGKKPPKQEINPVDVVLTGGLGFGMKTSTPRLRGGKNTNLEIVVRGLVDLSFPFGESQDFFPDQYGDPDGVNCFGDEAHPFNNPAGAMKLFEDGTATFQMFPEYGLVDDPTSPQLYVFFLEGSHDLPDFTNLNSLDVTVTFDRIEVTTEGKGQNRRVSCRDTFTFTDDGFEAFATVTTQPQ